MKGIGDIPIPGRSGEKNGDWLDGSNIIAKGLQKMADVPVPVLSLERPGLLQAFAIAQSGAELAW